MPEHVTLLQPEVEESKTRPFSSGLPSDLLAQSATRLSILALLYAFLFFMAGIFPMLLTAADRALLVGRFLQWGPSVISIVVALLVAALVRSSRLPLPAVMNIGLAFEVIGSYGIAAAEYADPLGLNLR